MKKKHSRNGQALTLIHGDGRSALKNVAFKKSAEKLYQNGMLDEDWSALMKSFDPRWTWIVRKCYPDTGCLLSMCIHAAGLFGAEQAC